MLDEDEDEEDEDDDEDEDIDEDDEDMDFKMVFVVNKSLELKSGIMSLYVAKSTAGLFKKINAQPQSVIRNLTALRINTKASLRASLEARLSLPLSSSEG